ncbi:MAG: integron integrase [Zetaproteobacteria bacterium CG_4_9_14_3_um_filter_49_83]|nr:MAG: integrase [Zetaproteobacteria bacterium CG1_02_49_23]PIQ34177.1 MAG: integrase [Zetaproteobacteria bacterium CG17_big_fil_post_rev_8_21_14_2_50_50_13]PIV29448.1 MAG: integron integrase [Zetaproteobacteria bacterium CG02_land_8_20_14_3_00_50_9]PIY56952.1 MAG: integron integrase [Zetaproteobacteria bacterium CG_4_10_14_0_8_um_filter_49_80]PJA35349.1 MAG: integron integrase [Zetaproteobacteria bacterium CG_4_9_14_3_um_filter_49_83]
MSRFESQVNNKSKYRPKAVKLMDQVHEVLSYHHYSKRTEEAYSRWIRLFIKFSGTRHPGDMGKAEVEAFLTYLAVDRDVSVSTQNQAFNGIVFLYREVLDLPLADDLAPVRAQKQPRLPVVLDKGEVQSLLAEIGGIHHLIARIMYGGGLRLMEGLRLRVQDIDFGNGYITIRTGKGDKDRTTLLPQSIRGELADHLERVKHQFERDVAEGTANVWLPGALAKEYPNAPKSWEWQYLFPSKSLSKDPESGEIRRHHLGESGLQKAIRSASQKAGINKRVTSHTLRHSFATHLLEAGTNIRVVQKLLGHADVKMTEIYIHMLQQNPGAVKSPLDSLNEDLLNETRAT